MADLSPAGVKDGRLRRTLAHLRAAAHELFGSSAADLRAWLVRRRFRKGVAIALVALVATFFATTQIHLKWRWYGLFFLRSDSGRPFELKDDLKFGDGPRLLWGVSFEGLRRSGDGSARVPRLELDWDEAEGSGTISSVLEGGVRLETYFGRYVDDEGKNPAGLFVGGSQAGVASTPEQNRSGMALRDARGWHHIWCNVNEGLILGLNRRPVFPGDWTFVRSDVLVRAPERVVVHSEHEFVEGTTHLTMDRYAYAKAGRTFLRLGINVLNVGDAPVTISYAYGDEPWVGRFGSAAGNVGWVEEGIVPSVAWVEPKKGYAGILDTGTTVANFIRWEGTLPDDVYFGNHSGTPRVGELGQPLTGNEIFIGLEWRHRVLAPGERLTLMLTIGAAARAPDGHPVAPQDALNPR